MALKQHSSVARDDESAIVGRGMALIAAILLLAVTATLGLRTIVSFDVLAPVVATLLFGSAAVVSGLGRLLRRYAPQAGLTNVAGVLTFVGIVVSAAIEPDQMMRLMALSRQPD